MSSNKLTIIYTFTLIEEKREIFFDVVLKGIKEIRAHEGCVHAFLSHDPKHNNQFTMVEVWENEALWKKFLQSNTVAMLSEVSGLTTSNWEMKKLYTFDI